MKRDGADDARQPRFCRTVLVGAIVCFGMAGCAGQVTPVPDAAQASLIAEGRSYVATLRSFTAGFTQAGALGRGDGTVTVVRPLGFRMVYASPPGRILCADRQILREIDQRSGSVTTAPLAKNPLALLLDTGDAFDRDARLEAPEIRADGGLQFEIVPISHAVQGHLVVTLSPAPRSLETVAIISPFRGTVTFSFDHVRVIAPDSAGEFCATASG